MSTGNPGISCWLSHSRGNCKVPSFWENKTIPCMKAKEPISNYTCVNLSVCAIECEEIKTHLESFFLNIASLIIKYYKKHKNNLKD